MIKYHPDDNLLTEYASGSLALALGLSVSAHLQLCPHCRQRVQQLNQVGAAILRNSVVEPVKPETLTSVLSRIQAHKQNPSSQLNKHSTHAENPKVSVETGEHNPHVFLHKNYASDPMLCNVPKVVAKLLPRDGKLKWQRVSKVLKTARLAAGQSQYEVAFQKISSGGRVVEHDHRGLEVTLVLSGSFSDEHDIYSVGDFLVRNAGEVHCPTATQNQDCLCLSVVAAPVAVTGILGKLVNPFLSFRPA